MTTEHSLLKNVQLAPYPEELADLVRQVSTPGRNWQFTLAEVVRDDPAMGRGESRGLTLTILITTEDTRNPGRQTRVMFYFPVPPATYDMRSWRRWLFERCRDVDLHELCEAFMIGETTPYAPSHGPGNDPYLVREVGTADDAEWRFNQPRPSPMDVYADGKRCLDCGLWLDRDVVHHCESGSGAHTPGGAT